MPDTIGNTSLIGRDHELDLLWASRPSAVPAGLSVVLLGGEAGVGKSRLVAEFVGPAAGRRPDDGRRSRAAAWSWRESVLPLAPLGGAAARPGPSARPGGDRAPVRLGAGAVPARPGRPPARRRLGPGAAVRGGHLDGRRPRGGAPRRPRRRGPPLGGPVDAQPGHLPGAVPRGPPGDAGGDVPLRRDAPLAPAAAGARRARPAAARAPPRPRRRSTTWRPADLVCAVGGTGPGVRARGAAGAPRRGQPVLRRGAGGRLRAAVSVPPTLRDIFAVRVDRLPAEAQEVLRVGRAGGPAGRRPAPRTASRRWRPPSGRPGCGPRSSTRRWSWTPTATASDTRCCRRRCTPSCCRASGCGCTARSPRRSKPTRPWPPPAPRAPTPSWPTTCSGPRSPPGRCRRCSARRTGARALYAFTEAQRQLELAVDLRARVNGDARGPRAGQLLLEAAEVAIWPATGAPPRARAAGRRPGRPGGGPGRLAARSTRC